MPAYYWIQLYKDPTEIPIKTVIQGTCDGLIEAGCQYQFSYITNIEEESLPQGKQITKRENTGIAIDEAINYTTQDLEIWRTTQKTKKCLPGITMIFSFDFQFDEEMERTFTSQTAKEVRQVKLDFWIDEDKFYEQRIVVNLTTWEEYVLMYGQTKTHEHNKREILKIVTCICSQILPYYGWLDGEFYGFDESYESIDTDNWSISDEFVVVGPQLINKLSKHNLKKASNLVQILENGCLILTYPSADVKNELFS